MTKRYWFRAKRYGWGWGLPGTWEGWAVLAAILGLFALIEYVLTNPVAIGLALAAAAALLALALANSEPPRWRWGGKR